MEANDKKKVRIEELNKEIESIEEEINSIEFKLRHTGGADNCRALYDEREGSEYYKEEALEELAELTKDKN